ncbi:carbohydrate ABC transporter permease [Egicoccus sp. AB-alg6-2]|uniref:carbohydrate ABC transporter permease n=1 Tax=Egicoccus sp. AB-alg6-2 TaxID=3242692 RepID=UPI00359D3E02
MTTTAPEATNGGSTAAGAVPTGRGTQGAWWTPYVFMAPYLALFVIFVAIPAVYGFWISLHQWEYFGAPIFLGVENYVRLFAEGSQRGAAFWQSMRATGIFVVLSVPLLLVLPLLVALVLNLRLRGRTFFRAVYFTPYVLGVAVVGLLWRFLGDPNIGAINYLLGRIGFASNYPWTTALPWGWILLTVLTVWWTLGFNTVIYLAGLQEIPREQYEAASVDGANAWNRFWHVTLPGLRRVLVFVVTVTVLASANMFGQAFLVTQGAPGNRTRTAVMLIAEEGLGSFRLGSAAAMSYILALFLMGGSLLLWGFFRRWEDEA